MVRLTALGKRRVNYLKAYVKSLKKTNHDNIIHLYKISMTQKQIQYYNSQISRMFLGAIVLETYYHPAEFGEERKIDHLLLDFGAKREFPNSRYWADSCLPIHHDFNWLMEALKRALSLRPDIYNIQLSTNIDEVYAQLCRMIDIINEEHEQ